MSLSGDKGVAQFKKSVKMEHPSKQLLCRWPIKKEVLEGGVATVWGAVGRNRFQPLLLSICGMDSLLAIIEMARLDARSMIYSSCQ